MAGLGSDRGARFALLFALVCAAVLAASRAWVDVVEAPESWWRLRWTLGAAGFALAAAAVCMALAWHRRGDATRAVPLAAAAAVLLALVIAL